MNRTSSWLCVSAEGRAGEDRHEQHKHLLTSKALLLEAGTFLAGANREFTGRVVGRECRGLEQNISVIGKHVYMELEGHAVFTQTHRKHGTGVTGLLALLNMLTCLSCNSLTVMHSSKGQKQLPIGFCVSMLQRHLCDPHSVSFCDNCI